MKKLLFFALLLFIGISAKCQNDVLISKVDPFTKKYLIKTPMTRITYAGINDGNSFTIGLGLMADSVIIIFDGNVDGRFSVYKGDKLSFLLDNDSVINFVSPVDQPFSPSTITGQTNTFDNVYIADTNKINLLIKYKIVAIRMYYYGGYKFIANDVKPSLLPDFINVAKVFMREYRAHAKQTK